MALIEVNNLQQAALFQAMPLLSAPLHVVHHDRQVTSSSKKLGQICIQTSQIFIQYCQLDNWAMIALYRYSRQKW